ncbi:MAG TPA: sucrose-phosphate phosphatase, partial [Coleofasciculaceae cyanobacterium]
MTAFLFVTDLDHTLVGDDEAMTELNQQLSQHRQEYGTKIVYSTGRSPDLYRELIAEKPLLSPDALITSVGTEICFNPEEGIFDPEWIEVLSDGWNREQVVATAAHFSDLVPQPDTEQRPFKVSYFLTEQAATEVIPRLESALKERNLNIKLVYSGGHDLDI